VIRHPPGVFRRLLSGLVAAGLVLQPLAGQAQTGAGGGYLSAPALPSTLPGGLPLPTLPPAAQQEILQRMLNGGAGTAAPVPMVAAPQPLPAPYATPPGPGPAPAAAALPEEPLSPAEAFFAARLDQPACPPQTPPPCTPAPLRQFGYDTLRQLPGGVTPGQGFGSLPEEYLLGRDDEVVVAFRGRARQTLSVRVARDGMLWLPDMPPIPAAGRTLRELRADLSARARIELEGSEVFVSIGQVRQFTVFVGGEVARPGLQAISALSSLLDALVAAGGVRRTGSLRMIRIEGPQGRRTVDLYPVIAGEGASPDLRLREGERILVPPLGGVVALFGEVTRPGVYELPPGAPQAPLAVMLRLAGDPLRPGGNRFLLRSTDGEGRRSVQEIGAASPLRRGDALRVEPGSDVDAEQLRLAGHVAAPMLRSAGGKARTLRGLLADPRVVKPDPYIRLGVVWRIDARSRARRFLPFDLARVLQGQADMPLQEGDEVILIGKPDLIFLASPAVQQALRGDVPDTPTPAVAGGPANGIAPGIMAQAVSIPPGMMLVPAPTPPAFGTNCPALVALTVAAQASRMRFAHARAAGFPDFGRQPCPQLFLDYPALLPFLLDQSVLLTGEVLQPGLYPILEGTSLQALLDAAGGITDTADLAQIELAREPGEQNASLPLRRMLLDLRSRNFNAVKLSPRDAVRVPRGFGDRDTGPVVLVGEFVRPGTYDIRRGEKLSDIIARAGGLTPQAYPYGAVFTRQSVQETQQEGFARSAQQLEQNLLQVAAGMNVAGMNGAPNLGGAMAAGQQLAQTLKQTRASGRMVVEANPVVLASRPDLDVLLQPGDLIAMPKRPNEVTVVGAVLNPGSLQFQSGWRAAEYVRASGGEQRFADGGRAFVVLPNGQSVPAGIGGWQAGGPPVPPGSTVVVPQDPSPYESWGFARDITQVLSQVALSSAALAVIARSSLK
jgi:polysaccharide biosynthesis/export protein